MSIANVRYKRVMRHWGCFLGSLVFIVACTKPNAAKHCTDGTCTTPAYPFCDVTGAIGGEAGTCIAISCAAGEFGECRGDAEVRCSANEHNYDVVQCERGCDPAADGCRLCNPGETACTNGKVATCDSSGLVTSMTECPLGCFENEPRCRQIAPSNGLGMYLDMVPSPPDVELVDAVMSTVTGAITDVSGPVSVPSFLLPAGPQGVPVRVVVVHNARIQKLSVAPDDYLLGPALAIVATGDITVTGLLKIGTAAGSLYAPGCSGSNGEYRADCLDVVSGPGGGAHATNGGKGGDLSAGYIGGSGGIASGTSALAPLRGGCSGGGTDGQFGNYGEGGGGGGAVQLTSATKIVVDGIIDVRGGDGASDRYAQESGYFMTGGGGGGGLLLEAPTVTIDVNGQLLASGGGGTGCAAATSYCGVNGVGAHYNAAAGTGGNAACDGVHFTSAGAGGGGLGRIRINTRDGTYSKANTAVEDGSLTTGTHATR